MDTSFVFTTCSIQCDQRITSSQIGGRLFECPLVSKKYLDHFSFDDLNGVTNSISYLSIKLD
jgi:hypothetical protein